MRRIVKGCVLLELALLLLARSFARFCALRLQALELLADVDAEAEHDVCMASSAPTHRGVDDDLRSSKRRHRDG